MSKNKLLLIVNPVAGKMKSKDILCTLVDTFCRGGFWVTVYTTAAKGDAREVVAETAGAYDMVVCCGGDGTLNEVIDGLVDGNHRCPLGYIPAGSTNDFASSLKLSLDPQKAARAIVDGRDDLVDVGSFNGNRRFAYIASFGAFTAASYSAPQTTKNSLGHLAYILEGIKELSALQSHRVRVESDGREWEGEYLFGAVCNSTSVAGLVRLNEDAVDMSDGLFEVILVRQPKEIGDLSRILVSLNTGEFDKKMFDFFRAESVTFHTDPPIPWSLDGEYEAGDTTVTVDNLSRRIIIRR